MDYRNCECEGGYRNGGKDRKDSKKKKEIAIASYVKMSHFLFHRESDRKKNRKSEIKSVLKNEKKGRRGERERRR